MEKDDAVSPAGVPGANYSTDFREIDTRIGRWWSRDPIVKPWESPYVTFGDNPIAFADPSGLDPVASAPTNPNPGDRYTDDNGDSFSYVPNGTDRDGNKHYAWKKEVTVNPTPPPPAPLTIDTDYGKAFFQYEIPFTELPSNIRSQEHANPENWIRSIVTGALDLGALCMWHYNHQPGYTYRKKYGIFGVPDGPQYYGWYIEDLIYMGDFDQGVQLAIGAAGSIAVVVGLRDGGGTGPVVFQKTGPVVTTALPKVVSLVKQDAKLLKLARETFEGNAQLSQEANGLIEQLANGNIPVSGLKHSMVYLKQEARMERGFYFAIRTILFKYLVILIRI